MKRFPLLVIVIAQFLGTSLWFSANGVADRLAQDWGITTAGLGYLTSAVQLGFIVGTLLLAISGLADRYPASRIFFTSALLGAIANTGFGVFATSVQSGVPFRFVTGLALAGIYPLGMKLVITWAPEKKGMVLGWPVGMLVLGTRLSAPGARTGCRSGLAERGWRCHPCWLCWPVWPSSGWVTDRITPLRGE